MKMSKSTIGRYVQRMAAEGLIDRFGRHAIATIHDQKASEPTRPVPTVGSISCRTDDMMMYNHVDWTDFTVE